MDNSSRKQEMTTAKFFLLFGAVGIFSLLFSFLTKGMTLCAINGIFGIPCPSCGMTRAFFALFRGEVSTAFFYHPLFWLIPLIPFVPQVRKKWGTRVENRIYLLAIGLLLLVWVIRIVLFFPHHEPMLFNQNGIIPQIISFLKK